MADEFSSNSRITFKCFFEDNLFLISKSATKIQLFETTELGIEAFKAVWQ